jgi:hypothetical protein
VEALRPPDVPAVPFVGWATGASWATVATRYGKLVDSSFATAISPRSRARPPRA